MTPSFRSSGAITQIVQQADGRYEVVAIQVNVVPVSPADVGNMDVVAGAAIGTFNAYDTTMSKAEIISALRYAADQLERHHA
ncbi:MAG TPA: hypothetical protein VKV80_00465 [Streptosporangiaceae bacterium]|nr:hypothetical protein [Streptosporangiaceae bacterium]